MDHPTNSFGEKSDSPEFRGKLPVFRPFFSVPFVFALCLGILSLGLIGTAAYLGMHDTKASVHSFPQSPTPLPHQKAAQTTSWKTYTSADQTISFKYPSQATVHEETIQQTTSVVVTFPGASVVMYPLEDIANPCPANISQTTPHQSYQPIIAGEKVTGTIYTLPDGSYSTCASLQTQNHLFVVQIDNTALQTLSTISSLLQTISLSTPSVISPTTPVIQPTLPVSPTSIPFTSTPPTTISCTPRPPCDPGHMCADYMIYCPKQPIQ